MSKDGMSKDAAYACNTESGHKGLVRFVIREPGISTVFTITNKKSSKN